MKMNNKIFLKTATSLITICLLLTITATVSSAQFLKKIPAVPASTSKLGVTRTFFPQTKSAVRFRPFNAHRILERKLYTVRSGMGLKKLDTWQITKSSFPIYKNQQALLADLRIYTTLQKPDRVVYLRPQSAHENLPETTYYVYELPQTLRYLSKGHIKALTDKSWVLVCRTDGAGDIQVIKKELEARNADPLHKPLPLSFAQLSDLPSSGAQLWKAIGGKEEEKYLAKHDLQGDLSTFFNIASKSTGEKPIGETIFSFSNGNYKTYSIYELPTDRITLNDLTYTKDNSYVLMKNSERINMSANAKWDPNTPAVTIVKKEEIESDQITWFNK